MSEIWTPYSSAMALASEKPNWVPEDEQERLAAYDVYDQIYWSRPEAFQLGLRGTSDKPVIIPPARVVVDETAYYLLKGLTLDADDPESEFGVWLTEFLKREAFYSRLAAAKHGGCRKGDWIFHITGDPDQLEGQRVSLTTVDPARYFPMYNPEDPDDIIGVDLVDQWVLPDEPDKTYVKRLRYLYDPDWTPGTPRSVFRSEVLLELEGWFNGKAAKVKTVLLQEEELPETINTIPVYHFKNIDVDDGPFGYSDLRGFETIFTALTQNVTDEQIALALDGIGVWVTDAAPPRHPTTGQPMQWSVGPGEVLEIGRDNQFRRAEGVRSVEPFLQHIEMLMDQLYRGAHVFDNGAIDVQLAESGIALAIKFTPTIAKIEQRDLNGQAKLEQLFHDLKFWWQEYEGKNYLDQVINLTLGQKLPTNRTEVMNELNNMLDRQIITREYYRQEAKRRLGYEFPPGMMDQVLAEEKLLAEARQFMSPENGAGFDEDEEGNRSNNRRRPNESAGTEANQDAEDQQRPR